MKILCRRWVKLGTPGGKSPGNEVKYSSHIEIFSVISFGGKIKDIWHALKRGPRVEILFHVDRLARPTLRYLWKTWAKPWGKP